MISVKNLKKVFGGNEALKGVSVEINKGDVMCVIGPSGSGKSTFLRSAMRRSPYSRRRLSAVLSV